MNYILAFTFVIFILVFVHEMGHYLIAKLFGVKIETFSIGFGRELFGFTDKSGTRWKIAPIPLGGYVKMFGDKNSASFSDHEALSQMTDEDKRLAFAFKPLYVKSLIVLAGPFFNFIFAILIFVCFYIFFGKAEIKPIVGEVINNSSAEKAGIKKGDYIYKINEQEILSFADIEKNIAGRPGDKINIKIKRNDEFIDINNILVDMVTIENDFKEKIKIGRIGIKSLEVQFSKIHLGEAFYLSTIKTYDLSIMILKTLGEFITGKKDTKELGGIIRIASYSGKSAEKGLPHLILFIALMSINLGVINLLPIPVLDGGHVIYYFIEFVRGKPVAQKFEQISMQFGIIFLVFITILCTFNDLVYIKGL